MSDEQSKDERLIQLMTEFLQSTNEKADESIVRKAHPELDNEETQRQVQALQEEVTLFKDQLQDVRKKVLSHSQKETYSGNGIEVNALQGSVANQNTKIGDLEYKVQILKTEMEQKKERAPKKRFGVWGWGLLASNVLLWSALGWFVWEHYDGDFAGGSKKNEVVKSKEVDKSQAISITAKASPIKGKPRGLPVDEDVKSSEQPLESEVKSVRSIDMEDGENVMDVKKQSGAVNQTSSINIDVPKTAIAKKNSVKSAPTPKPVQTVPKPSVEQPISKSASSVKRVASSTNKSRKTSLNKAADRIQRKRSVAKKRTVKTMNNRIAVVKKNRRSTRGKNSSYVPPSKREPQVRFGD